MMRASLAAAAIVAASMVQGCVISERTEDGRLKDVAPAALAALPEGVDSRFLIRDAQGCYGIAIEKTEPPSGLALRDADGTHICDD
ncbi:hypothetical protein [Profundibacterium mesophilum]|uniref:Prokaryotic membrane lipoprotein lipid attachment site domain containing protein n=1 Tax=Profundibacterium mesophilum KAUST100406-0324 TaxID=1037889 RepID=A0A921TE37_9RHOB|nr:hypothetical protein [Profundibacterium mesophilum]KAF0674999.1 Prokaryotic membrane lipoprotein lipid attachment site domain containing protein [Profundibacterium mesophilum KAUST100406-0324]